MYLLSPYAYHIRFAVFSVMYPGRTKNASYNMASTLIVSNLENYREPFREMRFNQIMENIKNGSDSDGNPEVWIPVKVDEE